MTDTLAQALTLRIERVIHAPRERVFDAWTMNEQMRRWVAPSPLTVPESNVDLRVGGRLGATMVQPDGTQNVFRGVFKEITRPSKLVYTYAWVKDNGRSNDLTVETTVTVEFLDEAGATRVILTQTGFDVSTRRDGHIGGWNGALDNLETLLKE